MAYADDMAPVVVLDSSKSLPKWGKWEFQEMLFMVSRRQKLKNFLALRFAPLNLRSGQDGPPAPLKGGHGKPLPLHPPSDASGIAQNC